MTNVALDDVDRHIAPLNCRLLRTITIAPEVRASGLIVTLPDSLEHDKAFVMKITRLKTNPDRCRGAVLKRLHNRWGLRSESNGVLAEGIARIFTSTDEPVG